jgi:hypothetical protein
LAGRLPTSAPADQLSFPPVWREESLSLLSANVRALNGPVKPLQPKAQLVAHPVGISDEAKRNGREAKDRRNACNEYR